MPSTRESFERFSGFQPILSPKKKAAQRAAIKRQGMEGKIREGDAR
jgi:hypothetical protein